MTVPYLSSVVLSSLALVPDSHVLLVNYCSHRVLSSVEDRLSFPSRFIYTCPVGAFPFHSKLSISHCTLSRSRTINFVCLVTFLVCLT